MARKRADTTTYFPHILLSSVIPYHGMTEESIEVNKVKEKHDNT